MGKKSRASQKKKSTDKGSGSPRRSQKKEEAMGCIHVKECVSDLKKQKQFKSLEYECQHYSCKPGSSSVAQDVWLCLKCCNRGCGRNDPNQHALKHFEGDKMHSVVLHLKTWDIWCYECDDRVEPGQSKHLDLCVSEVKKKLKTLPSSDRTRERKQPAVPPSGVRGLNNIGNTCFFNAVLQNLNQTTLLHETLHQTAISSSKQIIISPKEIDTDLNRLVVEVTDPPGSLCKSVEVLLKGMREIPSKKSAITPRPVFNEISKRVRQFGGFRQQDSHELLRYLLDEMKMEEKKRIQRAILLKFNVSDKKNLLSAEEKVTIKSYGRSVETFVDQVFGGKLLSSVLCRGCRTVSSKYEHFLDLSLAVPPAAKKTKVEVSSTESYQAERYPSAKESKHQQKKKKKEEKKLLKKGKSKNKKEQLPLILTGPADDSLKTEDSKPHSDIMDTAAGIGPPTEGILKDDVSTEESSKDTTDHMKPTVHDETSLVRGHSSLPKEEVDQNEGGRERHSSVLKEEGEQSEGGRERQSSVPEEEVEQSEGGRERQSLTSEEDEEPEEGGKEIPNILPQPFRRLEQTKEGDLLHSLKTFTSVDLLTGPDRYACNTCTDKLMKEKSSQRKFADNQTAKDNETGFPDDDQQTDSDDSDIEVVLQEAEKQFLIDTPPKVLTLHLKRFDQFGTRVVKNNRQVSFDTILDLAPFCTKNCQELLDSKGRLLYSLYGIVEHHGSMLGGHYVAYVKVRSAAEERLSAGKGSAAEERLSADKGSAAEERLSAGKGSAAEERLSAGKGSAAEERLSAGKGSAAEERLSAGKGSAAEERLSADKGSAAEERLSAGKGSAAEERLSAGKGSAAEERLSAGKGSAAEERLSAGKGSAAEERLSAGKGSAAEERLSAGTGSGPDSNKDSEKDGLTCSQMTEIEEDLTSEEQRQNVEDVHKSTSTEETTSQEKEEMGVVTQNVSHQEDESSPDSSPNLGEQDSNSEDLVSTQGSEKDLMDRDTLSFESDDKIYDEIFTEGEWYYVSDSHVEPCTESQILQSQAFLLFYELLPLKSESC